MTIIMSGIIRIENNIDTPDSPQTGRMTQIASGVIVTNNPYITTPSNISTGTTSLIASGIGFSNNNIYFGSYL
jgi:hypothetical protein